MERKRDFQKPEVVLHNFFIQLLQLTLFLILIQKFDQMPNFQPWLA